MGSMANNTDGTVKLLFQPNDTFSLLLAAALREEYVCTVSVTNFDPETNTYVDKDPEEMVKYLDKLGR